MSILEKEEERKNILNIFRNTRKAIKTEDSLLLKEMSNRTIHCASIYKDPTSVAIAVTIYALSKIIERKSYTYYKEWPSFLSRVDRDVEIAIKHLENKKIKEFHDDIKKIRNEVNNVGGKLKFYIQDVFRKAQISKASRLYEHGISRAETSRLLDISEFELAEYIGRTGISDVDLSLTKSIKDRIKFALGLFEK